MGDQEEIKKKLVKSWGDRELGGCGETKRDLW
jgi:hypothetical protein